MLGKHVKQRIAVSLLLMPTTAEQLSSMVQDNAILELF